MDLQGLKNQPEIESKNKEFTIEVHKILLEMKELRIRIKEVIDKRQVGDERTRTVS